MKSKANESLLFAALISVCIAFFLSFTTPVQANEQGTADELFDLFITELVKPIANVDSVEIEVVRDFTEILRNSRQRFGHLPEFWELMAQVDLRRVDIKRHVYGAEWREFNTQDDLYLLLNPKMLEKALEIDPDRPPVIWNLGRIKALDSWPDWYKTHFSERDEITPVEYITFHAEGLADAGAVDPDNGYYPFFEAVKRARLGDLDNALKLFEKASMCSHFGQPDLFPRSYALEVVDDFKEWEGVFEDFNMLERDFFYAHFYISRIVEDIGEAGEAYSDIIHREDENWRETFNILNKAACRLGKNDWGERVLQIVATILIKRCRTEALIFAKESKDTELEIALLALWHEAENIRLRIKVSRSIEERTYLLVKPVLEGLFEVGIADSAIGQFTDFVRFLQEGPYDKESLEWSDMWLTDRMMGVVAIVRDVEFTDKHIWHIFDRIEGFDYEDPLWWYIYWENEGRNSPAKDEESYREHCWT